MSYLMRREQRREKRNLHIRAVRLHGDLMDTLREIRHMAQDLSVDYTDFGDTASAKSARDLTSRLPHSAPLTIGKYDIADLLSLFSRLPEEID